LFDSGVHAGGRLRSALGGLRVLVLKGQERP
jgi:hypothetical protein